MPESISSEKPKGEWERAAEEIKGKMDKAFNVYFDKEKASNPAVSRTEAIAAFMTASIEFAFNLIHDEKVRRELNGFKNVTEEGVRRQFARFMAWHTLIASTPTKEDVPHRDLKGAQIEKFYAEIEKTGKLPASSGEGFLG